MTNYEKERLTQAVKGVLNGTGRILIADCYEGYELEKYKEALKFLLEEAEKKESKILS